MFANLAKESEERILQDIRAGRLLALHLDDREYRILDWQLGPTKHLLTLVVPTHAKEADSWAVKRMISTPTARLADRSHMEIVTAVTILDVGDMVCEPLMASKENLLFMPICFRPEAVNSLQHVYRQFQVTKRTNDKARCAGGQV